MIKPSLSYNFKINSKNCFWYSSDLILNVLSGSVPASITTPPLLLKYVTGGIEYKFNRPPSDEGFPILSFKVYLNNNYLKTLVKDDPLIDQITSGFVLGTSYKIQVSSTN